MGTSVFNEMIDDQSLLDSSTIGRRPVIRPTAANEP